MRFLLAIHYDESGIPRPDSPEAAPLWEADDAFTQRAIDAGVFVAAEALRPVTDAACVTAMGGEPVVTDGPFAETKEHLGGFYLLECDDPGEAIEWASRCPGTTHGTVQVRPVLDMGRASEPDIRGSATSTRQPSTS